MTRKYSHSALKRAQRCLRSWAYKYVERLDPADRPKYFQEGSDLHALLESYYDPDTDNTDFLEDYNAAEPEHRAILDRYTSFWGDDDLAWNVLHVEQDLEMTIGDYTVVFKPDMIIEINDEIWVVDHKTVANIPDEADPYNMTDFQHLLYLEGVRQVTGKMPRGFIFNYVRRKTPTEIKLVKDGSRIADLRRVDTDYDSLRSFAEKHGQLSDPNVQDRLKILKLTPNKYFQRHYIMANEHAIKQALADTEMALTTLEQAEETSCYPRNVVGGFAGSASCQRCEYQSLCHADFLGINRDMVALDYVERPEREKK